MPNGVEEKQTRGYAKAIKPQLKPFIIRLLMELVMLLCSAGNSLLGLCCPDPTG